MADIKKHDSTVEKQQNSWRRKKCETYGNMFFAGEYFTLNTKKTLLNVFANENCTYT